MSNCSSQNAYKLNCLKRFRQATALFVPLTVFPTLKLHVESLLIETLRERAFPLVTGTNSQRLD